MKDFIEQKIWDWQRANKVELSLKAFQSFRQSLKEAYEAGKKESNSGRRMYQTGFNEGLQRAMGKTEELAKYYFGQTTYPSVNKALDSFLCDVKTLQDSRSNLKKLLN